MIVNIIIIIIGSTALSGPSSPKANVAGELYLGQPQANYYNPFSWLLPLNQS
jgi:hypothetical protein